MTRSVDYDAVAANYARRYARNDYRGVAAAVDRFLAGPNAATLEVGCGTGHWLRQAARHTQTVVGIDRSRGMLEVARAETVPAWLTQGRAEALPLAARAVDRVFCVNALHHFTNPAVFFDEAARVLRPGGALLTIGLDPHTGIDRWWIYEYFPQALVADRQRYLSSSTIRDLMAAAGFDRCETTEIQHLPRTLRVDEAENEGFILRTSTSQLMVISDDEYEAGLARIRADAASTSGALRLESDLRLYGTAARRA